MPKEFIGLSCIHVGTGQAGTIAMLARVSLVDRRGQVLYDTFVQPTTPITSYRTATTGLDGTYFAEALPFNQVQLAVASWLDGRIIVGHQIWDDLQILGITHPAVDTRDVALFLPFRVALRRPNDNIGLPTLMWHLMRRKIQEAYVDSLENARATIDLFRSHEEEWEACIKDRQWPCALPPQNFSRCYS